MHESEFALGRKVALRICSGEAKLLWEKVARGRQNCSGEAKLLGGSTLGRKVTLGSGICSGENALERNAK